LEKKEGKMTEEARVAALNKQRNEELKRKQLDLEKLAESKVWGLLCGFLKE
jgi:hypothetical protein